MKIDFVYCEDWVGMYIDGKLVYQNNSINGHSALQCVMEHQRKNPSSDLNILGVATHSVTERFEDVLLYYSGSFPDELADCELAS